jgi:DNA-binding winged helix-turn-helix (wHTH) protein/tetratricopeptide (TPR) repeat protein
MRQGASFVIFRFGNFELDERTQELLAGGRCIEVERLALDVLFYLVRHRGRLVTKEELIQKVWGGRAIGDSSLSRLVSLLRKALCDDPASPRFLLTARGRGYRFVAPVEEQRGSGEIDGEVFVGRRHELAVGEQELARALAGSFRVLWISGAPGIGKTCLARSIASRARSRGALVLCGRGDEGEGAPALWPWIQILRERAEGCSNASLRELVGSGAADLAPLVPEIGARLGVRGSPPRLDVEQSRFRMFDSVARFLRGCARLAPHVLLLDDLHQVDRSSLLLLEFIARHLEDSPVLVVACFRDAEAAPWSPLARALGAIGATRGSELGLGPLGLEESGELAHALASLEFAPALLRSLHERTGGNPLFFTHIVRSLASAAATSGDWQRALEELRAPVTVIEAVRRDIERLPESARALLELASVMGREISLEVLRDVADRPLEELMSALDVALRARVLEPLAGEPQGYRFAHVLGCEALYAGLPGHARLDWHHRIACSLERSAPGRAPLSQIAHHFWAARAVAPAARVRGAQLEAAREAMRSLSFEDVLRYGQRALELPVAWDPPQQRIELMLLIAESCHMRGDGAGMRAWYFAAADAARELGRPDLMARAALGFFGVSSIGRLDAAWISLAEETLAALDERSMHLRARLTLHLSLEYYWAGHRKRGLELGELGEAMARALDDPSECAAALDMRLSLLRDPDRPADVLRAADEVLAILPPGSSPEIELRVRLVRHDVLFELARLAEARIEYQRIVRASDALRVFWPSRLKLFYWLLDGRHTDVEGFLEEAMRAGRLDFAVAGEWTQNFMVAFFHLRWQQGRLAELAPVLAEWAARFPAFAGARLGLALAFAEAGQLGQGRELLRGLVDDGLDFGRDQLWLWMLTLCAEASLALGETRAASLVYDRLAPYAGRIVTISSASCLGSVDRALGRMARALGRAEQARIHLEQALEIDARLGDFLRLVSVADLAEVLRDLGPAHAGRSAALAAEHLPLAARLGLRGLEGRLESCIAPEIRSR